MPTNGDYIRPLPGLAGITLPDSTRVGLMRAIPVSGPGVRDALSHVKPGETFADDDWLAVIWDDAQTLGESPLSVGPLTDAFDGTSLSSAWVVLAGAPTVSGGRLHLKNTFPVTQIRSVATGSLSAATVSTFGLLEPIGSSNDAAKARGMILQSTSSAANFLQFIKLNGNPGQLLARTNPGTTVTFPYNAAMYANRRIRGAGGQIYFEVSANGTSWNVLRQVPAPTWVASQSAFLIVYGGCSSSAYSDPNTESSVDRVTWA